MILKKYKKIMLSLLLIIMLVFVTNNKISAATSSNKISYTYYTNNKVKTKLLSTYKDGKLSYSYYFSYSTSGVETSMVKSFYDKSGNFLARYYYKTNKSKRIRSKTVYYFNTHTNKRVSLKKPYKTSYYNSKGKYVKSIYHTTEAKRNAVVAFAKSQKNKSYKYGSAGPNSFDCSGLTLYTYKKTLNKNIGRTSVSQSKNGKKIKVSKSSLKPGDLLFWGSKSSPYHVGIYLGNGKYIHAQSPSSDITIKNLNTFKPTYAKRIIF